MISLTNFKLVTVKVEPLDKQMDKPWIVLFYTPHDTESIEFASIYDKLAEHFKNYSYYFAAVDIYENEDVRDRIVIQTYPQLIYIDTNSIMYRYNDQMDYENLEQFIENNQWNKIKGKKIPKEINYFKRVLRKITSFYAYLIYSFIISIIGFILYYRFSSHKELLKKINQIDQAQQEIQQKKEKYYQQHHKVE